MTLRIALYAVLVTITALALSDPATAIPTHSTAILAAVTLPSANIKAMLADYNADLRRVMTIETFLERNSLSKPTFRRLRLAGLGPRVVQLGLRRIGITYLAELEWQNSRTGE